MALTLSSLADCKRERLAWRSLRRSSGRGDAARDDYRSEARLSHKSPGAKVRRQMSRSKDFWEGSETNQSPGNGPVWAAADICDSLRRKEKRR